jgi:PadR family transcriptional regulator PadR
MQGGRSRHDTQVRGGFVLGASLNALQKRKPQNSATYLVIQRMVYSSVWCERKHMTGKKNNPLIVKWESQVRKGMLDFIVLLCLEKQEYYGYELVRATKTTAELDISEGTIYPLLNRLKNEGLITSRWVEMEAGIPRKYYRLTAKGRSLLPEMKASWQQLGVSLHRLMEDNR